MVFATTVLAAGCAAGDHGSRGSGDLMGLDDQPAHAVWRGWTPRPAPTLVPPGFVDEVVAFDYWQIGDQTFIEQAWTGASAIVDYVRREGLSQAQDNTATLLLQALDRRKQSAENPSAGHRRMDVTYVVALDPDAPVEGLVVRLYTNLVDKHVAPGLAIYLGRAEGSTGGFDRALVWAEPRFEEAEPFTVSLRQTQAGWLAERLDGAVYPESTAKRNRTSSPESDPESNPESNPKQETLEGAETLAQTILRKRFWRPLVSAKYVEGRPIADGPQPTADSVEPALGLEVRERQIEEVYRDTVFPPRTQIPPIGRPPAP